MVRACEDGLSFGLHGDRSRDAEFICQNIPHVEMIRMVNSGTEAVMSASGLPEDLPAEIRS